MRRLVLPVEFVAVFSRGRGGSFWWRVGGVSGRVLVKVLVGSGSEDGAYRLSLDLKGVMLKDGFRSRVWALFALFVRSRLSFQPSPLIWLVLLGPVTISQRLE